MMNKKKLAQKSSKIISLNPTEKWVSTAAARWVGTMLPETSVPYITLRFF